MRHLDARSVVAGVQDEHAERNRTVVVLVHNSMSQSIRRLPVHLHRGTTVAGDRKPAEKHQTLALALDLGHDTVVRRRGVATHETATWDLPGSGRARWSTGARLRHPADAESRYRLPGNPRRVHCLSNSLCRRKRTCSRRSGEDARPVSARSSLALGSPFTAPSSTKPAMTLQPGSRPLSSCSHC